MAALLGGCSIFPHNLARNHPAVNSSALAANAAHEPSDVVGETAVALSFSGGGTRAAAFSFGALQALDSMRDAEGKSLLDDVSFITSVSGGSLTAAYYGLHGRDTLNSYRRDALLKNGEANLRFSLLNPLNLTRLIYGGLNDHDDFEEWLDRDLFKGATFADMFRRGKPLVWINATDVYHRIAFPFNQRAFDALCSDLASYPVSEAVAASMAVPLFFAPVVLEKHPDACYSPPIHVPDGPITEQPLLVQAVLQAVSDFRNAKKGKFVKLIDGGVTDNYGLTSIQQSRLLQGTPYGPLTEKDVITIRRLLFVVVDAGQKPSGDWDRDETGPGGFDLANAAIDSAIDTNVRMSYDSFLPMVQRWEADVVKYRCSLPAARQAEIAAEKPGWRCDDVHFSATRISFSDLGPERMRRLNAIPTRLQLPESDVDATIDAGREAMQANRKVREFSR